MSYKTHIDHYLEKHGFEALRPKAVLFDMDGVLYDSMPNHAVAWQRSMAKFGITMTAHDAYATEGARGVDTIRMMVKAQLGRDIDEQEAQLMYDEKTRQFHQLPETRVMPGIPELMAQIHADGLQIGVVTGSGQRPLIDRLLKDFGDYLEEDHITTAYDVKQGKPHPDPYLMGLRKMGSLAPCEALVIENAPLGVEAGVAARIFTIAVNTGPLTKESLLQKGANLVFDDMLTLSREWRNLTTEMIC
ncbi:MAG: HAD hydrolase-like protein [Prevotella sp.]|nr:HAD hydrolase-like protein [Prevotella sp.]